MAAAKAVRTPAGDISLVLDQLASSTFEPLTEISLKFLSFKCLFLVALATSRRCSEIHALSGLSADIAHLRQGDIELRFLPEFRGKNQRPDSASPSVVLKALPSASKVLCPVRALKTYLKRIAPCRRLRRRLLLPDDPLKAHELRAISVLLLNSEVCASRKF